MKKIIFLLSIILFSQGVISINVINLHQKLLSVEKNSAELKKRNQKLETEIATYTSCYKIFELTSKDYFLETFSLREDSFVAFKMNK